VNNKINNFKKSTPFSLMFGRKSTIIEEYDNLNEDKEYSEEELNKFEEKLKDRWVKIAKIVWPNINKLSMKNQEYINSINQERNRKVVIKIDKFKIGDIVYKKVKEFTNYKTKNLLKKWEKRYEGPFIILRFSRTGVSVNLQEMGFEERGGNIINSVPLEHLKAVAMAIEILEEKILEGIKFFETKFSNGEIIIVEEKILEEDYENLIEDWKELKEFRLTQ
jgi:hypothetical protein